MLLGDYAFLMLSEYVFLLHILRRFAIVVIVDYYLMIQDRLYQRLQRPSSHCLNQNFRFLENFIYLLFLSGFFASANFSIWKLDIIKGLAFTLIVGQNVDSQGHLQITSYNCEFFGGILMYFVPNSVLLKELWSIRCSLTAVRVSVTPPSLVSGISLACVSSVYICIWKDVKYYTS